MNITESQKHAISEKLNRAIEAEHIMLTEAARNLGTSSIYLSMIRYPKQWPRCAKSGWEAVYQWANSGQKLSEFSVQHGAVSPRQAEELKPEVKKVLVEEMKEELKKEEVRQKAIKAIQETGKIFMDEAKKKEADNISTTAPLAVESVLPEPGQQFTDTARLKVALDIEINLVVNGQKVQVR